MTNSYYDLNEAIQHILRAAMVLSPNGIVQEGFAQITHNSPPGIPTIKAVTQALLDGVEHGNWPTVTK